MSDEAPTKSPTPILDLEVPVGKRRAQFGSQVLGFVGGLAGSTLFFATFRKSDLPFPLLVLVLVIAVFAAVLVHELGHMLVGWGVGFHFSSIQITYFRLGFVNGKLRFGFRRDLPLLGYAGIQIDRVRRLRKRLFLFTAGGPAASIGSVVILAFLMNAFDLDHSWIATPAGVYAYVSLVLGMVSLVPMSARGFLSDGARLANLISFREKSRRWFCLAALANAHRIGRPAKTWNNSWTNAATAIRDGTVDEIAGCWIRYVSSSARKQLDVAAGYLERSLELASSRGGEVRDTLCMEAAIFQAWHRRDLDKATRWLDRVNQSRLPRLSLVRGTIAMECARGNFEAANVSWEEGRSLIEKLLPTKLHDTFIDSWLEWREEIQDRQQNQHRPVVEG
jgi:hypothetical protein